VAYSEELAERIREVIEDRPGVTERKMFGGIAWMINSNMACGIIGEDLMVRLDRDDASAALAEEAVGPMEFTGRPMRGFVMVEAAGIDDEADLARWVDAGADFAESLPPKS
jgi:TfoX/Sxy family transcriptional regulator of competence genes